MNKTTTRVLSMVVTVFMLVSMLTAFALATAQPFATSYECAVTTVDGDPQISKAALLVDRTINEANGATVTRAWDGEDYTFVVGTNAFKTLAEAYAFADAATIESPEIIITGWKNGDDLEIAKGSSVYGVNWNTAPMNEMGDVTKVGVNSNGQDWTANEKYAENEMKIGSIIVSPEAKEWVGIYGFTITKYITLGKGRALAAADIEFLIKNCKMAGVETDKNILTGYDNTDPNCSDILTFQNFWLDSIGGGDSNNSRFFGDNTRHIPHMIFDAMYIDFSNSDLGFKKANDHLKAYFVHSSLTWKNSNLRRSGSGDSPYWTLYQRADATAGSRELYYDNNTLFNTNQAGGFINVSDDAWSKINVTNNFVVATTSNTSEPKPLFAFTKVEQGLFSDKTFTITGNKLLGVKADIDNIKTPVAMFIEDNFTVGSVKTEISEYEMEPGEPLTTIKGYTQGCSGAYIYNYDMKYSSFIKIVDVDFGPGSEVEIGTDTISIKCLGEQEVITPIFTVNPNSSAKGEPSFELSNTSDFAETIETVDIAEIAKNKTATFYLRAYYPNTTYETVYQIKVIAATPVDFNDAFMQNGFDFAGKHFVFKDTAIFVYESELEADGSFYGYGFLDDEYYRFKVDNTLVFDSMSMLKTQMTGVENPNILLPSGDYGNFTFEYPANYYGTNAGINPVDKTEATSATGDDWTFNNNWGAYSDTAFDTIYFADGLEGDIYLNGMTIRGQVNDTQRTMGTDGKQYGNLNITFDNIVVHHIRTNEVKDDRDESLISANIGETTVDKIFNLVNKRAANKDDTQTEFIENQNMKIEYFGFSDTYADSFTVKNLYVKDMRNAVSLFNDFIPANFTIDGLYMDFSTLGAVENTVGNFKTGAAVKSGSFTFINSNLRNGNDDSTLNNIGIQGPRGQNDNNKLSADNSYVVKINDNIFYNSVPSGSSAKSLVVLATSMISSFEVKDNVSFQTGDNVKKKAFILSNTAATLKDHYGDADLAILGNMNIDGNKFVGFDDKDVAFDIGLGTNNPVMKNAFVSEDDDAHENAELITGVYATSMGNEMFYLDYANTISSDDILVTDVTTESEGIRYIEKTGLEVSFRIYSGTLADVQFVTKAGTNTGVWASNRTGSTRVDASEITVDTIGVGSTKTYYYVVSYTQGETLHKYIYTVKVTAGVDCETHNWSTTGTSNNDATCLENGTMVVTCTNTGCIETNVVEQPDSKVACDYIDYVYNNDATCMNAGTETGACRWCQTPNTRENATLYPIVKTAHKWSEYTYDNNATCCKDGTETRVCEHGCGASQTQVCEEHLMSTIAHVWGEYTYDGTATCVQDGTKSAMCTEEGCRIVNTIKDPDFPASDKGHVWGEYTYNKDATTAKDGTKTASCELCGDKNTITAEGTKLAVTIEDSSKKFKDVKSAWYKTAVDYVTSHGFVSGVSNSEFGVGTEVSRAMFVTILARMAGVDTSDAANKAATTKFSDVAKGRYYTAAVKWANENGIVAGTSATTFGPDASISRQDLCVMVVNFVNFMDIKLIQKEAAISFTDAAQISGYAKNAVTACQRADIINGYTNGAFGPRDTATREQASQILYTLHSEFMA